MIDYNEKIYQGDVNKYKLRLVEKEVDYAYHCFKTSYTYQ